MGTLRLLLALCVVLTHTRSIGFAFGTGGATAVQCFYVVSGFFMALILNEKYTRNDQIGLFYSNRFLRVFSLYWLFFVANILLSLANYRSHRTGTLARLLELRSRLGISGLLTVWFGNVFLLSHDWTDYLSLGTHGLHLPMDAHHLNPLVGTLFFVPQAWTLGLEITFYLLAPFLVRRSPAVIGALVIASLSLRWSLVHAGFTQGHWFNGFFPVEVGMFLLGTLAYKAYARWKTQLTGPTWAAVGVLPIVIAAAFPLFHSSAETFFNLGHVCLYLSLLVGLPALFVASKRMKWDRAVGELSYPVYLCHEMFTQTLGRSAMLQRHPMFLALLVIAASCALSILVVRYVDVPLNEYRESRVRRSEGKRKANLAVTPVPALAA